ncbi:unnamed protein product [Peronospora farinosa]|uniref:Reverse transcriptase Ty1/copia-type domain-containing protein n=1 Tax=Peronospora farinosa TaxID=134698 RepID=A0AAV0U6K9_9STRA|nr:unnamed protein product [Peronospora farinosa]
MEPVNLPPAHSRHFTKIKESSSRPRFHTRIKQMVQQREIRTIVTIGRSMLHHANLDKCFWGEAAMAAIYIKNRLPSPKIASKTPFEFVYKSMPSVKHIRVFGCWAYILTPKEKRCKWDAKACVGVFMGYEEVSKAYRVYDIEAGQVVISRDVTFDKSSFGFSPMSASEDDEDVTLVLDSLDICDNNAGPTTYQQTGKRKNDSRGVGSTPFNPHSVTRRAGLEESSASENTFQRQVRHRPSMQAGPDFNEEEVKEVHKDEEGSSTPPAFWRASVNAVEVTDLSEPATFQDAVNGPDQVHWRKAINAELESLRLRGVFQAATLPKGQQAIGTKWVFKIKRKADASIEKYKARLVAQGFKQKYGIDYTEMWRREGVNLAKCDCIFSVKSEMANIDESRSRRKVSR